MPFPIFLFHVWFYTCSVYYVAFAIFIIKKYNSVMFIKKKKSTNDLLRVLNVRKGKVRITERGIMYDI